MRIRKCQLMYSVSHLIFIFLQSAVNCQNKDFFIISYEMKTLAVCKLTEISAQQFVPVQSVIQSSFYNILPKACSLNIQLIDLSKLRHQFNFIIFIECLSQTKPNGVIVDTFYIPCTIHLQKQRQRCEAILIKRQESL